jgi:hypothetical protein
MHQAAFMHSAVQRDEKLLKRKQNYFDAAKKQLKQCPTLLLVHICCNLTATCTCILLPMVRGNQKKQIMFTNENNAGN